MAKKPETLLQESIQEQLRANYPGLFLFKVHGGPFQTSGLPDLIGCYGGYFFGLEVKMPKKQLDPDQVRQGRLIEKAGGFFARVTSVEEALDVLREVKALSKSSGRPVDESKEVRTLFRPRYRKDVVYGWNDRKTSK